MKILAIGSHPDDIEFGCGGTLINLREKQNAELYMLVMSDGKRFRYSAAWREEEQEKSAEIIGATCKVLGMDDTYLDLRECINAIESSLKAIQPTHVFTPYHDDTHQDHRTLSEATVSAMRESINLLFYECISTRGFSPTLMSNIDETIEKKCQAIDMHESQSHLNLAEYAKTVGQYHAYRTPFNYVEAFTSRTLFLMDSLYFVKQEIEY